MASTYSGVMYAVSSAPEYWQDILIDIMEAEDSDDDNDVEINPYN